MGRLLLERVTTFCGQRNLRDGLPDQKLKLEFSDRGGMSYSQLRAYLEWIKLQSKGSALYLNKGDLDWSVVDTKLVEPHRHRDRAGLQLADVVASAFYQAVEMGNDGCNPSYAMALKSRMAKQNGVVRDFGVKAMPSPLWKAQLLEPQKQIFEFYGYSPRQVGR